MLTIRAAACNNFLNFHKFSRRIACFSSTAIKRPRKNPKQLPAKLKRTIARNEKTKMYIDSDSEASRIADAIKSKRKQNVPLVEMRAGPGILTKYLTKLNAEQLLLYENDPAFVSNLRKLIVDNDNVKLYEASTENLWRTFNARSLLKPFATRNWDEDVIAQAVMIVPSVQILRSLCSNIIYQNGVFSKGRIEFFFALPAADYVKLTCGPDSAYSIYQARSVIFQLFFEHEYLLKIDRSAFRPLLPSHQKCNRIVYNSIETDYFYLCRIVPRRELLLYCEDLKELAHFVCQCFSKRGSWIMPKLEKWIRRSGLALICNQSPAIPSRPLNPSANFGNLPKFSRPSMQLTTADHFPDFHTFTKSAELTPEQMFALFHWFKALPKYPTCGFIEDAATRFEKKIQKKRNTPGDKFKRIVNKV